MLGDTKMRKKVKNNPTQKQQKQQPYSPSSSSAAAKETSGRTMEERPYTFLQQEILLMQIMNHSLEKLLDPFSYFVAHAVRFKTKIE